MPLLADCGPELPERRLVSILALQKAAVAAQNLLGSVAGRPLEGGVDVYQRAVGSARVGDRDGIGASSHRPFEKTQPVRTIHRSPSSATSPSTIKSPNDVTVGAYFIHLLFEKALARRHRGESPSQNYPVALVGKP